MLEFIFSSVWGWIGTAGVVVVACVVVGWFFPQFRGWAFAIGAAAIYAASVYTKGSRDRARLEQRRRDAAVRKAQKEYSDIEARPDTADDVIKRMRNNGF